MFIPRLNLRGADPGEIPLVMRDTIEFLKEQGKRHSPFTPPAVLFTLIVVCVVFGKPLLKATILRVQPRVHSHTHL